MVGGTRVAHSPRDSQTGSQGRRTSVRTGHPKQLWYPSAVSSRSWLTIALLFLALAGVVALRLLVGDGTLAWAADRDVLDIRLRRVVCGIVVGAALALGGVKLQCLLRNPLASPDILGLASGAGLAVMITAYIAYTQGGRLATLGGTIGGATALAALLGSLGALALVYLFAQRRGRLEPVTLILVGVVLSIVCSAGTTFVQHMLPDRGATAMRWSLGALSDDVSWFHLAIIGSVVALAGALSLAASSLMDRASLADDEAAALGVPLHALRIALFVSSGVLTAAAVILAGPIGFVGLICPHVVRLAAGPRHAIVVLGSLCAGPALVVGADTIVKALDLASGRLPIGVITPIIGAPVLLTMLRKRPPQAW